MTTPFPCLINSGSGERTALGRRGRAFTLVELLVSITILTVLVGVLFQVFNATVTGWQRAENRTDAFREARAALALMARDISQTIPPTLFTPRSNPPNPLTDVAQPAFPTLILDRYRNDDPAAKDDDIATVKNDPFEQLHCLTLVSNVEPSALCAVSYFCRWDDNKKTYSLARRLVGSTDTFNRFKTATAAHTTTSGTPPTQTFTPLVFLNLFLRVSDPKSSEVDAAIKIPDANDLATYVWDLQFRVDTNLKFQPTTVGSAQTPATDHATSTRTYAINDPGIPNPNALPTYVEIRFKALSANAGARLRGSATRQTWTDTSTALYRTAILPASQQFVRRVPLNNVPTPTVN